MHSVPSPATWSTSLGSGAGCGASSINSDYRNERASVTLALARANRVDGLAHGRGGQVLKQRLVDECRGSAVAGADAFQLDERELAVVGGLAHVDAQLGADRVGDPRLSAHLASNGPAHLDQVPAAGLEPVFFVKAG